MTDPCIDASSHKKAPTWIVGAAMKRMEKLLLDSKSFFLKYHTLNILIVFFFLHGFYSGYSVFRFINL
jgi:uncharacterized membrane protein